jgi:hypothetical protein
VKHAIDTQVFVDVWPTHTLAITDDSIIIALSRRASLSRHDHPNGTLMTRPSIRLNVIRSSVTVTVLTRASALTAMLIPSLLNLAQFSFNDRTDLI